MEPMTARTLVAAVLVAVGALSRADVSTQKSGGAGPPLVVTAFGGRAFTYNAPKTSWREPDLQGVWSSNDTKGILLSRPSQFGDRLFLTPQEYADRERQVNRGVEQAQTVDAFVEPARRAFPQTSLIVDPPNGQIPAYTAEGLQRPMPRGTFGNGPLDSPEDFSLYERCITRGLIGSVLYGGVTHIVQSPGVVSIIYETIHDTRIIYTDGRPHLSQNIRKYFGDSRGQWHGDELVVETTNFTDRTTVGVNGTGNRHSARMKMTERLKRVAHDILQYQITIDDPATYQRPFTLSMPLTPSNGGRLLPYECHEGNMALLLSLAGERAEDKRLQQDLANGIIRPRHPVQDGDVYQPVQEAPQQR
jgi:hypothetical protein